MTKSSQRKRNIKNDYEFLRRNHGGQETMQQSFESIKGKDVSTQDVIVTENTL